MGVATGVKYGVSKGCPVAFVAGVVIHVLFDGGVGLGDVGLGDMGLGDMGAGFSAT